MIEVEGAGTNFPPRAQDTFERERLVGLKLICYSNGTRENILQSNSLISLGRLTKNTNQTSTLGTWRLIVFNVLR